MKYHVISADEQGFRERVVYKTSCPENCSTFAESYFINRHAHKVRAIHAGSGRTLSDLDGRDYEWERKVI